jgi:hypothetical protein
MALLAEMLVDEWMNRKGFFTVRGLKDGVAEIDLLGVRPSEGKLEAWHVEVQASFRPIGYISKLTPELARRLGKAPTSAWRRSPSVVKQCAAAWVHNKFQHPKKHKARERAWPGLRWKFVFVHCAVKEEAELRAIESTGIELCPFHKVLGELCAKADNGFAGASATDIAEIVAYYEIHCRNAAPTVD